VKGLREDKHMRRLTAIVSIFALGLPVLGQIPTILGGGPRDVIENYWDMGVRGELLTRDGWEMASGDFVTPGSAPEDLSFDVFSNRYGVDSAHITANTATVEVGFKNVGHIDSRLRYSPPRKLPSRVLQTAFLFRLAVTPLYVLMYGPDGKSLVEKKPTGNSAWKIVEPAPMPWTTVNTAIRYVLEMRNKTIDPIIKKNADETLTQLLALP
jgi:hypothetical protein